MPVLIVDDARTDQFLIQSLMKRNGVDSLCAGDGEEALATVETADISVVLTDMRMPRMDGVELTSNLRLSYPHIPVVLMATQPGNEDLVVSALQQGAASFVLKNSTTTQLGPVVANMLQWSAGQLGNALRENEGSPANALGAKVRQSLIDTDVVGPNAVRIASAIVGALGVATGCPDLDLLFADPETASFDAAATTAGGVSIGASRNPTSATFEIIGFPGAAPQLESKPEEVDLNERAATLATHLPTRVISSEDRIRLEFDL